MYRGKNRSYENKRRREKWKQKLNLGENYQINRVINGCWQLSEGHSIKNDLDFDDVMRAFHMLAEEDLPPLTVAISIPGWKSSLENLSGN